MNDKELMQQALDALNHVNVQDRVQIITALRERLNDPNNYWRDHASEYEKGVIDGMSKQAQRSVDRAVNAMHRPWQGLTEDEKNHAVHKMVLLCGASPTSADVNVTGLGILVEQIETKLKEKNHG